MTNLILIHTKHNVYSAYIGKKKHSTIGTVEPMTFEQIMYYQNDPEEAMIFFTTPADDGQ